MLNITHIQQKLPQSLNNNKYHDLFASLTTMQDSSKWDGAVNIVLIEDHILMIKRSHTMPSHKGQIAFIGGIRNQGETDPVETAFREFTEETSLDAKSLNLIGILPPVYTARMKRIISVLSTTKLTICEFQEQVKSNGEWDMIFAAKLEALGDLSSWTFASRHNQGQISTILYRGIHTCEYELLKSYQELNALGTMNFWGASARMLWNLFLVALK